MAATGDLKIDAIAPAAAQLIRSVFVFRSRWSNCPKFELIAAPDPIAGPKSPTEPPNPTANGAVIKGW